MSVFCVCFDFVCVLLHVCVIVIEKKPVMCVLGYRCVPPWFSSITTSDGEANSSQLQVIFNEWSTRNLVCESEAPEVIFQTFGHFGSGGSVI